MIEETIVELEEFLGFKIDRKEITIDEPECHDENLSYPLCLRLYGNLEDTNLAIDMALKIRDGLNPFSERRRLELFNALLGNLLYLKGDFPNAMGYFMKNLSLNRNDITPWIECLFCLRAMGHFRLFENGIFNFRRLVLSWQDHRDIAMDQKTMIGLIKAL